MTRTSFNRGFTVIELLLVSALLAVGFAMAATITPRAFRQSQATSSAAMVASVLREAREEALAKRRNIEVAFLTGSRSLRVSRIEYDWTVTPPTEVRQLQKMVPLEGTIGFVRLVENGPIPSFAPGDKAVTYPAVGDVPVVIFDVEGSATGADGLPLDGTIFLGRAGEPALQRAVTMSGVTAMIERWQFDGKETWTLTK